MLGRTYYHNPTNHSEVRAFIELNDVPVGWVKGNPYASRNAKRTNLKNAQYYHNPTTGDEGRFHSQPDGWVAGRAFGWYTNGIENKLLNKFGQIPDGFKQGKTPSTKTRKQKTYETVIEESDV